MPATRSQSLTAFIFLTSSLVALPSAGQIDCTTTQITNRLDGDFGAGYFSSDSSWLVFFGIEGNPPQFGYDIYRTDLRTGFTENLTQSLELDVWPTINGDGTQLAFGSRSDLTGGNPDGNQEIFWADLTTQEFFQVTDTTSSGGFAPVINTAGNRVLLYSSDDLVGENPSLLLQAFLYDIGQAALSQVTHATSRMTGVSSNSTLSLLVFGSTEDLTGENPEGNSEIFVLDVASGELTQITQTAAGDNIAPTLSDDGQRIVFLSTSDEVIGSNPDSSYEIAFHDRQDGGFMRLTNANPSALEARITPDGSRILMSVNFNLILYDIATGAEELFAAEGEIDPQGSTNTDGTLLSFRSSLDLTGDNPDRSFELFLTACSPLAFFADAFESGDTSAWSSSVGE